MAIRPLSDRILVRPDKAQDKSKGGIVLPDAAKEKMHKGTVLATGPGKWNDAKNSFVPMQVKKGDRVLFTHWAGTNVKEMVGEDDIIMLEGDILAILD